MKSPSRLFAISSAAACLAVMRSIASGLRPPAAAGLAADRGLGADQPAARQSEIQRIGGRRRGRHLHADRAPRGGSGTGDFESGFGSLSGSRIEVNS